MSTWSLKLETEVHHLQNRNRLTDLDNNLLLLGGWDGLGVWGEHVNTAIFKMDINKEILYGTGNSAQCYVAAWRG